MRFALAFAVVLALATNAAATSAWQDLETRAATLLNKGDYRGALSLWTRALKTAEVELGPEEARVTTMRSRVADLERLYGDLGRALEQATQVLRARLKSFGAQHQRTGDAYTLMSRITLRLADPDRALEFAQKALRVRLLLGPQQPDTADAYEDLGMAKLRLEQVSGQKLNTKNAVHPGLELLEKARRVRLRAFGATSLEIAQSDTQIGAAQIALGNPKGALERLLPALNLRSRTLGSTHPDTATTETTVALAEINLKRFASAQKHLEHALRARQQALGLEHPDTATTLSALGTALVGLNEPRLGLEHLLAALDSFFSQAERVYRVLDTPGKLRYNLAHRSRIRATMRALTENPVATDTEHRAVTSAWLSFKGMAFSLENGLAPLSGQAAGLKNRIDEYLSARTELAALFTRVPTDAKEAATIRDRIDILTKRLASLERELSSRVSGFDALLSLKRLSASETLRHLSESEALIDYAWFESGLYAISLTDTGVRVRRLTDTPTLETQIAQVRNLIQSGASLAEVNVSTVKLYDTLIRPLEPELAGVTNLTISPDGPLNFLPFELLWNGDRLVLDRFTVRTVPTGRDLVRLRSNPLPAATGPAAVFGNPEFTARNPDPNTPLEDRMLEPATRGVDRSYLSGLLRRTPFPPLPYTEREARTVSGLLGPDTRLYLGADANEQNLFALRSPRILHLATHGFFLADAGMPNPLLRVGVALAGARTSAVIGEGYGLLSGLRLEGLHLAGTELVVLSACETALGRSFVGEGVAGFNQVFLAAGARRVMLTLWKVPDLETAMLMEDFYSRWKPNTDPARALQAAKLELVNRGVPPKAWAAVVLSGE